MKSVLLATLLATSVTYAQSDVAVVVSRTPRFVTVNQQQCTMQEVVRSQHSNEGKVIGGLAGAALGSTLGGNSRDNLAGGVIGALVGGAIVLGANIITLLINSGRIVCFPKHSEYVI